MNTDQQVITELYFNGASLENLSAEQLNHFIAQYPHSAAARILLLKKIGHGDPDQYKKQLFTTTLYLSNPLMLNQFLGWQEEKSTETAFFVEAGITEPTHAEHGIPSNFASESVTQEFEIQAQPEETESKTPEQSEDALLPEIKELEHGTSTNFASASETQETETRDQREEIESPIPEQSEDALLQEIKELEHGTSANFASESVTQETETREQPEEIESSTPEQSEDAVLPEIKEPEQGIPANFASELVMREVAIADEQEETETPISEQEADTPLSRLNEPDPRSLELAEAERPELKDTRKDFAFEAFHSVDYFASQGIRLRPSELGKDKLGQQLKSFTDWLRSMKRLPEKGSEIPGDESAQQTISIIAAHSLEEKEVITEAMAQVWAKQGNRQKAIAIYQKLSLQNPSKSPYFAAKIDQLNSF